MAQTPRAASSQPTPLNALTITQSDLKKVEQEAYNQGFDAGRRYQRKRDQQGASALVPDNTQPDAASVPADNGKAPAAPAQASAPAPVSCPPQAAVKPSTPAPLPPLPSSSSYTTSGPAQPLPQ